MNLNRRDCLTGALALSVASLGNDALAQSREATLRQVMGGNVNTLDPTVPGASRESAGMSMSIYDRLITFGRKQVNGNWVFDQSVIVPELAERVETSADRRKITLHIRSNATWHDGTPVTAEDIKWSLDRCVSAKSLAPPQFQSGSMYKPEQFRIAGPRVVEILLDEPNRLAIGNLGLPYAIMINSTLAKKHATADDPWALKWLQANAAASGAYMVESFRPGEAVTLRRNPNWKSGPNGKPAHFERVICQSVPEASTRANLVERGDADIVLDLQVSDIAAVRARDVAKVVSNTQTNGFTHISFNTQVAPFNNVKVRQAFAAAFPYNEMFKAALFGRGQPLFGATWSGSPTSPDFPAPMPNHTDLARAKALLVEAGYPNGLDVTFNFALSYAAVAEPMAALMKESLAKIGVNLTIQKLPDTQLSTLQSEKKLSFYMDTGSAWLPATYYFFWVYFTRAQRWNLANWDNPRVFELVNKARTETNQAAYDAYCREMISIMAAETPLVLAFQANIDAVMAKKIDGFTYHFHRQLDYRDLRRV